MKCRNVVVVVVVVVVVGAAASNNGVLNDLNWHQCWLVGDGRTDRHGRFSFKAFWIVHWRTGIMGGSRKDAVHFVKFPGWRQEGHLVCKNTCSTNSTDKLYGNLA